LTWSRLSCAASDIFYSLLLLTARWTMWERPN
jgi:hypothetical protein